MEELGAVRLRRRPGLSCRFTRLVTSSSYSRRRSPGKQDIAQACHHRRAVHVAAVVFTTFYAQERGCSGTTADAPGRRHPHRGRTIAFRHSWRSLRWRACAWARRPPCRSATFYTLKRNVAGVSPHSDRTCGDGRKTLADLRLCIVRRLPTLTARYRLWPSCHGPQTAQKITEHRLLGTATGLVDTPSVGRRPAGCRCAKEVRAQVQADGVRSARRGDLSQAEVAADFDISVESVRCWVRQADIDDGVVDGQTSADQNEFAQLCRDGDLRCHPLVDCLADDLVEQCPSYFDLKKSQAGD
jgi:transposase